MASKQHPPTKRTVSTYQPGHMPAKGQRVQPQHLHGMDLDSGQAWLHAPKPAGGYGDYLCVRQPRQGGRPPVWVLVEGCA